LSGHTGITRHSPRNGLRLIRTLPGDQDLLVTVIRAERELDANLEASGPHDFAVRFRRPRQGRYPRPPHPRPALVTLRNAPLNGTGWHTYILILDSEKQKYFFERGLTRIPITRSDLPVG